MVRGRSALAALAVLSVLGCSEAPARDDAPSAVPGAEEVGERNEEPSCPSAAPPPAPDASRLERDEMFSLLAFAVAAKGFQEPDSATRGRNIAAVLVDSDDQPVCWSRNASRITRDATQHAEMRLLRNERGVIRWSRARAHRLYSTLEPCVMCAGTILMHRVASIVYGEEARPSGGVFERLSFDASSVGGPCPHPYTHGLDVRRAPGAFFDELEAADVIHLDDRAVFERAVERLTSYRPQQPSNDAVHRRILEFLESVPEDYQAIPYTVACPFAEEASPSRRTP